MAGSDPALQQRLRELEAENRQLRIDREIIKMGDAVVRQGKLMRFAFIRDHLVPEFTVKDCCCVLGVSMSGYYRWRRQPVGVRLCSTASGPACAGSSAPAPRTAATACRPRPT